ncbi:hypothetical protein [Cupriavidus basilensis]|uniref:hypothetical protein n=1 Tax=Cupriavidus basilensis TaxID=68895 RepID=UPI00114670C5|nr:hypothetical protein [Cupriavidus basilensis]
MTNMDAIKDIPSHRMFDLMNSGGRPSHLLTEFRHAQVADRETLPTEADESSALMRAPPPGQCRQLGYGAIVKPMISTLK